MNTNKDVIAEHLRECAKAIENGDVGVSEFEVEGMDAKYILKITMVEVNHLH